MLDRNYFPQYGRVAIIDDNRDEVEGLMALLSLNAIPYIYLEQVPEDFREMNCEGFRIVFLDLVLSGSNDVKTVKSLLYANLNGLLKENNGPCTIAIWSTKVEHYEKELKEVLNEIDCKSCDIIYLDKLKYKKYDSDLISDFEKHFAEKFKQSTVLQYISLWENSINRCMIDITYKFDKVLPNSGDNDRGGHYASNLARLILSKQLTEGDFNNEQKLYASYEGLNTLLNKESNLKLNNLVSMSKELIDVSSPEPKVDDVEINTLLWIGDAFSYQYPKNVYKIENIDPVLKRVFVHSKKDSEKNIYLLIDITNKCTYVQSKTERSGHQLLYAILFEDNDFNKDDRMQFLLRLGKILYNGKIYTFVVMLCAIVHKSEEEINSSEAVFSISDEVYTEIRSALGSLYSKNGKTEL